jgi:Tfp pilus assembly protein PilO
MKRIGGITAGAAILLLIIWYIAVFRPQQHKLTNAHRQDAAAAQQVNQLQQQIVSLRTLEREIPADTARLKALDASLPQTEDLQDILNQLHQAAVTSNVQLTSVDPSTAAPVQSGSSSGRSSSASSSAGGSSTATPAGTTMQVGVSMTMTGTYAATMTFMSDLAHMNRIVVVDSASFSPSANGGSIGTSLSTRIFYAG